MPCFGMTSINAAFSLAVAGLQAAKTQVAVRAQNISNAQTPGYVPITPEQTATAAGPRVEAVPAAGPPRPLLATETSAAALLGGVDLATEAVGLISAKQAFKANAAVLKVADEVQNELLDAVTVDRRA
ncbi:MAG: hypothetical protein Tsb0010_17430 [Parvularculaceae bacterium]